ncbi:MAG TPA: hypothetical protein DD761_14745 [Cyanobacteria bacterium UBA11691]|nr:hypothetical protein [Cyanobacteria bacterium UBA11691]
MLKKAYHYLTLDSSQSNRIDKKLKTLMKPELQTKVAQGLVTGGAALFLIGGVCVASGLLSLKSVPPGLPGTALLMEVAGLGLTEKNREA